MDTRATVDWIQAALLHKGMSQAELARQLSERLGRAIDRAAVNKLAKGRRRLMLDEMVAISQITGFRPLRVDQNGDEEHLSSEEVASTTGHPLGGVVFDGAPRNIPAGEIPQVDARLGLGHSDDVSTIQIAIGNNSFAAVPVVDTWKIPANVIQRRFHGTVSSLHIVECMGDSMEPRIHDGDFVFIDTAHRTPSPPGIFALFDGLGQTLKRLEVIPDTDPIRVRIIPNNPQYTSYEELLSNVKIIGRYVGRLTMD
ncbi:S24 family peptidase [Rhodovulum sp. PH10]|uniref:S24 family peptidase n=1 Tax=Rhodovulum sp. PH10 TaxID=1187851 RepID=UPI00068F9863|nr:S24 family peptidase [Rhodovulum sp. PH10]